MDSEKPKQDPSRETPPGGDSARDRVERLTRPDAGEGEPSSRQSARADEGQGDGERHGRGGKGKAAAGDVKGSGGSDAPPRLTERQRREAREKRRRERRGGRGSRRRGRPSGRTATAGDGQPSGNALSRGVRATLTELKRTAGFARGLILTGLDRLGPAVRSVTAAVIALAMAGGRLLARLGRALGAGLSRLGSLLLAVDRALTPRRALIVVAAAAAATLVVSQFTDFRATEIGRTGYDSILDITRAPRTDVLTPFDTHSVLLLLAAGAALAGIAGMVLTGRRVFATIIALSGAATIAVALLIDLPRGLDVGDAEISYSEVAAVLLSGFWIQLGAGLVLTVGGLVLLMLAGSARQPAAEPQTGRRRERSSGRGTEPSSAGAGGVS